MFYVQIHLRPSVAQPLFKEPAISVWGEKHNSRLQRRQHHNQNTSSSTILILFLHSFSNTACTLPAHTQPPQTLYSARNTQPDQLLNTTELYPETSIQIKHNRCSKTTPPCCRVSGAVNKVITCHATPVVVAGMKEMATQEHATQPLFLLRQDACACPGHATAALRQAEQHRPCKSGSNSSNSSHTCLHNLPPCADACVTKQENQTGQHTHSAQPAYKERVSIILRPCAVWQPQCVGPKPVTSLYVSSQHALLVSVTLCSSSSSL